MGTYSRKVWEHQFYLFKRRFSFNRIIHSCPKISSLMRRMEALEIKEPVPVNQVSPNQFSTPGCTYCQIINHVFEECPIFKAQQIYPEPMNAAFSRPQNDPYTQTYNPDWKNHPNFSWSQNNNDHSRSNHLQHPNHNENSSYHQPNYHHNSSNH